jgi:DNA-packaging protein gp3
MEKKKHAGGRPQKYTDVELFQQKIDEYFAYCDNKTKEVHSDKLGDMIMPDPEPYCMSGLAYALDMSRQSLINYKKKTKFLDAIKKARRRVEKDIERRLGDRNTFTPGLIFSLKNNFNWKDKTETDIESGGKPIKINTIIYK